MQSELTDVKTACLWCRWSLNEQSVRMYYGSGTGTWQTLRVHSPGGGIFLRGNDVWPPSWT